MSALKKQKNMLEKLLIIVSNVAIGVFIGLLSYNQLTSTDSLSGRWVIASLYLILIISNCVLFRKVAEIKRTERYQRSAVMMLDMFLLISAIEFITYYDSMMSSFHYGYMDSFVAKLTTYCLPSALATVSILVVLMMLLFKAKKNLCPMILMLVSAAAFAYEIVIILSNPFAPDLVYDNSAWSVSRLVADIILLVELAVLLRPNKSKDIN